MNKSSAIFLFFLIIQFTERFNFTIDFYKDREWTNTHLTKYLRCAQYALKSNNLIDIVSFVKQPDPNIIRKAITAKINNPEEQKNQIALFDLWINNKANLNSPLNISNWEGLFPGTYGYDQDLRTHSPVIMAAYCKNFKIAKQLLKSNPISFSSDSADGATLKASNLFYLKIIMHSSYSAYDLEFFLKNNVEIPEEYESLETVKNARENIERRKCIQYLAAQQRRRGNPSLPCLVQKNISDFLQPQIYDNVTRQKHDYLEYKKKCAAEEAEIIKEQIIKEKDRCCTIS